MVKEVLLVGKISLQKAFEVGVLPATCNPRILMAKDILRIWEHLVNSANQMLHTVTCKYITISTPAYGCPDCLSPEEPTTRYNLRESVKWALKTLHCITLQRGLCPNNPMEANPAIPWITEEDNVLLQIHGKSKTITGSQCAHVSKPAWWKQPMKVEWVRTRTPVGVKMNRPLLHPNIPKQLLRYSQDPNQVHPVVQLMATVNGRPSRVWTDTEGSSQVLHALMLPKEGKYTVYMQTSCTQQHLADLHIMRKQERTPLTDGEWTDPMGLSWKVDRLTVQGDRMWKAMLYAVEELQEQNITLGGTMELVDVTDLEEDPINMQEPTLGFQKLFIPVGEGIWAQGDASNPQDGDTVSGMAKMTWNRTDEYAVTEVANIHADVPTAEARILLDILWEQREREPTVIHYITDCEFVCWIHRWAMGTDTNPDKRCLWHIVKQLKEAIRDSRHKIYVWKTLSHICNPGLRVMDGLAKFVVAKKTTVGYKPQGVAATLQRTGVLLVEEKENQTLTFRYTGATCKVPTPDPILADRHSLPIMKGAMVKSLLRTHIDFATRMRLGILPPHNWSKHRDTQAMICPLCDQEIYVNHSTICEAIEAPPLLGYLMEEVRRHPRINTRRAIRYVNKHMEGAILEQFTRGIILQQGQQVVNMGSWNTIWRKAVSTLYERHRGYWDKIKSDKRETAYRHSRRTTLQEGDWAPETVEELYTLLKGGRCPVELCNQIEQTATEMEIRQLVNKRAPHLMATEMEL